jgi:hypothetical protein
VLGLVIGSRKKSNVLLCSLFLTASTRFFFLLAMTPPPPTLATLPPAPVHINFILPFTNPAAFCPSSRYSTYLISNSNVRLSYSTSHICLHSYPCSASLSTLSHFLAHRVLPATRTGVLWQRNGIPRLVSQSLTLCPSISLSCDVRSPSR